MTSVNDLDDVHVFERQDPRLGRHMVHDPRSRDFRVPALSAPTEPVMHERGVPIWDQGDIGSCTANAALGMLCTGPLDLGVAFDEHDARAFYSIETRVDDTEIPGVWPPSDTGSTGLWSCKTLKRLGYIRGYLWAFTTDSALAMLGRQPLSIGVGWRESMFEPDRDGVLSVRGPVSGGHQVCLDGVDPGRRLVRLANSWGPGWGQDGWAWLSWGDLDLLLRDGGDAVTATL